ncbi:MAG: alpha/beta hydrolase [Ktedonobacterales bacterium]|jgi:pimeloyl-ACP methyl ester carboxylesterase|nr:MAG: alpha/beta hydrolase [Ktedonobacterales bacterium]
MSATIVFIHGAWMTPLCWEPFVGYFQQQGYTCVAPPWPYRDKSVEELRSNPPAALAGLGVAEIVDHYARIISALDEPPILIGHSFGGLFVQMLLDQGLGRAGVALDPAPPKGVPAFKLTAIKALSGVLTTWMGWKRILRMSLQEFQYAFVNTLPPSEQKATYERQVVPETGRIFFQAALAPLNRHSAIRVRFDNGTRAPLLLIAGAADNIVPASVVKANHAKYKHSPARTDFKLFPGRTHWLIAQDGWAEVAGYAADWLRQLPGTPA